jgi:protein-S-isoprenylcysteine O-methyltransferase Ste14
MKTALARRTVDTSKARRRKAVEEKWLALIIATSLPLAFVVQHLWSEACFARRGVALGGQPTIGRWLFVASKYLANGIWLAVALQSWGFGWQPFAGVRALRGVSGILWVLGFGLLFLGRINLGDHFRMGLPDEPTRFHCGGAYRFTRNPMYTGIDLTMIAAILYTGNPAIVAVGAFVIAIHHRIILVEERWMLARYGGEYQRYRERVGRYVTVPLAVRGRTRALLTLLGMGHCAPTVMSSMLQVRGRKEDWLVRLASALPGGIGNMGDECGGITSPLILLGVRHGLGGIEGGLPPVFEQGLAHVEAFRRCRGTLLCREIRTTPRQIVPCIRAIACSGALCAETLCGETRRAIPCEARAAYGKLYAEFTRSGFHCAQTVLRRFDWLLSEQPHLLDAGSAFLGGTLFEGMTCGALTAGVMAIGLSIGEIEHSWWRVLRMVFLILTGGPAFDDGVNRFNRAMNRGGELAAWFAAQFGSTQCRAITGADFSSPAGVEAYLQGGGIPKCQLIARKVADHVRLMLGRDRRGLRQQSHDRLLLGEHEAVCIRDPALGNATA